MTATIRTVVAAALEAVLPNTSSVELPPNPTWPAVVFNIETEEEQGWCQGGVYERHKVHIVALGVDPDYLDQTLMPAITAAMQAIQPAYMFADGSGDAEYEPNPDLYGRFQIHQLRMRR